MAKKPNNTVREASLKFLEEQALMLEKIPSQYPSKEDYKAMCRLLNAMAGTMKFAITEIRNSFTQ